MAGLYGKDLEDQAAKVFRGMGLICAYRLNQVLLQKIDPADDTKGVLY